MIERQFLRAAAFALAGAVLTFFGFMHGEQVGLAESPAVALSYLLVFGVLAGCARPARWVDGTLCPPATKSSEGDQAWLAFTQVVDPVRRWSIQTEVSMRITPAAGECGRGEQVNIEIRDTAAHQFTPIDKVQRFSLGRDWRPRKVEQQGKQLHAVLEVTAGQFADHERMD